MMRNARSTALAVTLLTSIFCVETSIAQVKQEVVLKNGLVLTGATRKSLLLSPNRNLQGPGDRGPYTLVDEKFKRYFLPHRLMASVTPGDVFKAESFKLKHRIVSKKRAPDFVGGFKNVTPWDKSGVRTVTLQTPGGPITVTQAISLLTADYVWVRSLNYNWQYGIPTTSIAPETLHKVLQGAINMNNPNDRIAACRYLMNAGKLSLADQWVTKAQADFPAFKDPLKAASVSLRQLFAKELVGVLLDRSAAGQHKLVTTSLEQFPKNDLPTEVLNSVERLKNEYAAKDVAITRIHDQLEQLEGVLEEKLIEQVQPLRMELKDNLDYSSLERLDAYMNLAKDQTLKPEERLAIAYSGWMLGSANAITNLPETLGLSQARKHVAEYLGSDDLLVHRRATDELARLEGVDARSLSQLLKTSPPFEPTRIQPGVFAELEVETRNGPAKYKVVLPPEYSPFKTYPMIVALKQANQSTEAQLAFWSGTPREPGQGQRRGYIVLAPEFEAPNAVGYESNPHSHEVVTNAIRDAFRRFSVDSDRVFLVGHGTGADAVFDIGMSYPDVFAGAIPICGVMGPECSKMTTNGSKIPWYIVTGEKHLSLPRNAHVLHQIAITKRNNNVLICEYKDRGYEGYYDEIQRMFDWMESYTREALEKQFEVATVRPESNRFYWIEASGFAESLRNQNFARGDKPVRLRSVEFNFRVTPNNSLAIKRAGAEEITLRLLDGVFDFTKSIRVTGGRTPRGFSIDPRPAIEDVLKDFQLYRDRNRIALQRVRL